VASSVLSADAGSAEKIRLVRVSKRTADRIGCFLVFSRLNDKYGSKAYQDSLSVALAGRLNFLEPKRWQLFAREPYSGPIIAIAIVPGRRTLELSTGE
jgi:hypothetical protein